MVGHMLDHQPQHQCLGPSEITDLFLNLTNPQLFHNVECMFKTVTIAQVNHLFERFSDRNVFFVANMLKRYAVLTGELWFFQPGSYL